MVHYWRTRYEWKKQEALLNTLPHFTAEIDGFSLHFIYEKSNKAQATPIILLHGSLKIEHQAVTLAQYGVELQEDRKQVQKVSSPRLVETPFRSPQLTLFDLGLGEWVLYWRAPGYAPHAQTPDRGPRPTATL